MEGEFGVPTAPIVTSRFAEYVIRDGQSHGMNLRWAFPPYPVAWVPRETLVEYINGNDPVTGKKLMTEVIDALTKPLTEEEKNPKIKKREKKPRLLEPDTEANLNRLLNALSEFGAPKVNKDHFKEKGNVFRMGRSPIKIDVINEASGIDIEDCYSRRDVVHIDGIDISLISKEDLIKNKRASGRSKDIADVENLEDFEKK